MLLCIQHVIVCTILTERLFPRPPRLCIKTRASLGWAWPLYSLSRSWRVEIWTLRSCITVPGISVLHYHQNHTRMFDGCNNTADGCCVCLWWPLPRKLTSLHGVAGFCHQIFQWSVQKQNSKFSSSKGYINSVMPNVLITIHAVTSRKTKCTAYITVTNYISQNRKHNVQTGMALCNHTRRLWI